MLIIKTTNKFEKDYKRIIKSGQKDIQKLQNIIRKLENQEKLDPINKNHKLTGNWKDHLECHIEPDWLLIYKTDNQYLILVRTGSHSELFK